jgi:hypothetical protein
MKWAGHVAHTKQNSVFIISTQEQEGILLRRHEHRWEQCKTVIKEIG